MALTTNSSFYEEINSQINSENACHKAFEPSYCFLRTVKIRKTIILHVGLYDCETWSRTLREEHRLGVLENRMLREIFGRKRDEVTGDWRELHNDELHSSYSSPDIRLSWWGGCIGKACSAHGELRNTYKILVGKPDGTTQLDRRRHRLEDNIKMDVRKAGLDCSDFGLARYGLVYAMGRHSGYSPVR
jgi:hypothetical protein